MGLLCARNAQPMLLPFRGSPQNVQASVRAGRFGRGCTAPVPSPSSPPQAYAALLVAQAHQKHKKARSNKASMSQKHIFMSVGSSGGGSRSVTRAGRAEKALSLRARPLSTVE